MSSEQFQRGSGKCSVLLPWLSLDLEGQSQRDCCVMVHSHCTLSLSVEATNHQRYFLNLGEKFLGVLRVLSGLWVFLLLVLGFDFLQGIGVRNLFLCEVRS